MIEDTLTKWLQKVEKAEKEIGWKNGKLYNKEGILLCKKSEYKRIKK